MKVGREDLCYAGRICVPTKTRRRRAPRYVPKDSPLPREKNPYTSQDEHSGPNTIAQSQHKAAMATKTNLVLRKAMGKAIDVMSNPSTRRALIKTACSKTLRNNCPDPSTSMKMDTARTRLETPQLISAKKPTGKYTGKPLEDAWALDGFPWLF